MDCKNCIYKDKDFLICNSTIPAMKKPTSMKNIEECGRYIPDTKWNRMSEEHKRQLIKEHNENWNIPEGYVVNNAL